MDISALIEIAVAGTDPERLEIAALEPVGVTTEAVGGLMSIVSELVHSATESSAEGEKVRVSGRVDPDGYLIEVADRGLGVSDQFLDGLNRVLEDPRGLIDQPDTMSGMYLVAALAARRGVQVRLAHGTPGMTAQVSVPWSLIEDGEAAAYGMGERATTEEDATGMDFEPSHSSDGKPQGVASATPAPASNGHDESVFGNGISRSAAERRETESFLERVFSPLMGGSSTRSPDTGVGMVEPNAEAVKPVTPEEIEPLESSQTSSLRTRVPGENYDESSQDASHTKPGEAAVEIKLALSDYDRGRQAADVTDGE